ncbi:hypothetical protein FBQ81_07415 [Chloroflexi bacterium CFX6]|nr:hypothetical protein [Chloroflexi bacterium CFX6]
MAALYKDRLTAIQQLLASSHQEEVEEGYDSLFNLWLENSDLPGFIQDLIPIAAKHETFIREFKERLNSLITKDVITDTYLQQRLNSLESEIAKYKINSLKSENVTTPSLIGSAAGETNPKFAFWQIALAVIILVTLGLMFVLPNTFQKGIMLLIAVSCTMVFPYIFSQKQHRIIAEELNIKLNYSFPKYLSVGDENIVDFSMENPNETGFTGELTMVFDDDNSLIAPVAEKSLSAHIDLLPHNRVAKQFNFVVKNKPADGNINFYFLVLSSSGTRHKTNTEFFLISPIPHLRSIWSWLFGSAGLGALIIALLWEELKELLGL